MSSLVSLNGRHGPVLPPATPAGTGADRHLSKLVAAHSQECPGGLVLRAEGDRNGAIYLVLSGWMAVSRSTLDGNRLISDVGLPGNVIDPASADVETSAVEVEALTDVTYAAIPRATWARTLDEVGDLRDMVQRETGAALTRMSARMLRMGKSDAESVIAYALCELALRSTGTALAEIRKFTIPMTQQQLGDFCGLSSVHICRTLRRLRDNGVLEVRSHMDVTIRDVEALTAIAQVDPDTLRKEILPKAPLARAAPTARADAAHATRVA